jgi:hypothetical protein
MDEDIKKLLEQNLELNQKIYKICRKLNNYMIWSQIYGFLKIIIIVVPLILAYFYLAPYLTSALKQYTELMGVTSQTGNLKDMLNSGLKSLNQK